MSTFMDAIMKMSDIKAYKEIVLDMSDFYEEWTRSSAKFKNRKKLPEYIKKSFSNVPEDRVQKVLDNESLIYPSSVKDIVKKILINNIECFREVGKITVTNLKWTDDIELQVDTVFNSKLSYLADFTDEVRGTFTHMNHDVVLYNKDKTYLICNRKTKDMMDRTVNYTISFDTIEDFENLDVYPRGLRFDTPMCFNSGAILLEPIQCVDEVSEIEVHGTVVINSVVPIMLQSCRKLIIKGSGTLVLEADIQQPCIGNPTSTGLSYGRWEPGRKPKCEEILIDGVTVACKSKVDNFSIGHYGTNYLPDIKLINGAKLDCPEYGRNRYISYQATAPSGSTKICESMSYSLE